MTDAELLQHYIQCKPIIHGEQRSPGHHRLLKLGFIKEHHVSINNLLITATAAAHFDWLLAGRMSGRPMWAGAPAVTRELEPRHVPNHSIYSADRTTHLKVVIVALIAGILVAGFGISMRNSSDEGLTQTARVMKAGKPVMVTTSNKSVKS